MASATVSYLWRDRGIPHRDFAAQPLGSRPVSGGRRVAWNDASQLRLALSDRES
jgi:hypothetical protein